MHLYWVIFSTLHMWCWNPGKLLNCGQSQENGVCPDCPNMHELNTLCIAPCIIQVGFFHTPETRSKRLPGVHTAAVMLLSWRGLHCSLGEKPISTHVVDFFFCKCPNTTSKAIHYFALKPTTILAEVFNQSSTVTQPVTSLDVNCSKWLWMHHLNHTNG